MVPTPAATLPEELVIGDGGVQGAPGTPPPPPPPRERNEEVEGPPQATRAASPASGTIEENQRKWTDFVLEEGLFDMLPVLSASFPKRLILI